MTDSSTRRQDDILYICTLLTHVDTKILVNITSSIVQFKLIFFVLSCCPSGFCQLDELWMRWMVCYNSLYVQGYQLNISVGQSHFERSEHAYFLSCLHTKLHTHLGKLPTTLLVWIIFALLSEFLNVLFPALKACTFVLFKRGLGHCKSWCWMI